MLRYLLDSNICSDVIKRCEFERVPGLLLENWA
jgi:predicted nucleic acid-binding protein